MREVVTVDVPAASEALCVLSVCTYQVAGTFGGVRGCCYGPQMNLRYKPLYTVAAGVCPASRLLQPECAPHRGPAVIARARARARAALYQLPKPSNFEVVRKDYLEG